MDQLNTPVKTINHQIRRQKSYQCLIPITNTNKISARLEQNVKIIEMINKNRFSRSRSRRKQQLEIMETQISQQTKEKKKEILEQIVNKLDSFLKQSNSSLDASKRSHSLNLIKQFQDSEKPLNKNQPLLIKQLQIKSEHIIQEDSEEQFKWNLIPPKKQEKYNESSFVNRPNLRSPLMEQINGQSYEKQNKTNYVYRKYIKPEGSKRGENNNLKYLRPQIDSKGNYIYAHYLKPQTCDKKNEQIYHYRRP